MAGDEEFRRASEHHAAHRGIVPAWIAAYVLDEDIDIFAFEAVFLGEAQSEIATVYVAEYCSKWCYLREFVCHFGGAYVACVPYFITLLEILLIF